MTNARSSPSSAASSAHTASLLVLLQLASRLVTFTLNQALLSFTTPAAFGTATIQLEPLLNTVLFLSREGIRNALIRRKNDSTSEQDGPPGARHGGISGRRAVYTISLIPLAAGIPLSVLFYSFYARSTSLNTSRQPFFLPAVILYGSATCLELLSEPFFNRAQLEMDVKLRVSVEGSAVIVRAITTLLAIVYGGERWALLAFGLGQFAYATTLVARYYWHYKLSNASDMTSPAEHQSPSDQQHVLHLAYALTKQSVVKQVLTEGDKVIVSRISPVEDQGGYGLALNYGSLVARILFQPLEESSRLFYSQALGDLRGGAEDGKKDGNPSGSHEEGLTSSARLLSKLLKLQLYLALVFTCFAPFYVHPLLYHLLGRRSRWLQTTAPDLLQSYLFLLPLLGFNGLLEAFVQAVADERQLGRMSAWLLAWSGLYCASCYILVSFVGMKEEALIWSNAITMLGRCMYSIHFIKIYFKTHRRTFHISRQVTDKAVWPFALSLISAVVMRWSGHHFNWRTYIGFVQHVAVGVACFLVCVTVGLYSERTLLSPIFSKLGMRRAGVQKDKTL